MLRRIIWYNFTDVSEVLSLHHHHHFLIALMMEAVSTSETSSSTRLFGAITQMTVTFT
jgi:hypothetical protein